MVRALLIRNILRLWRDDRRWPDHCWLLVVRFDPLTVAWFVDQWGLQPVVLVPGTDLLLERSFSLGQARLLFELRLILALDDFVLRYGPIFEQVLILIVGVAAQELWSVSLLLNVVGADILKHPVSLLTIYCKVDFYTC